MSVVCELFSACNLIRSGGGEGRDEARARGGGAMWCRGGWLIGVVCAHSQGFGGGWIF